MESGLVSWQFENFSSAELISPPVSPSPPSPSLYNNGGSLVPKAGSPNTIRRAQIASNILSHLEEQGPGKMEINDFGMNWNEESVNLSLFDELEELENTPPASPKLTFTSADQPSSPSYDIQIPHAVHNLNNGASESTTDISVLTAEFQAILDSLPKESLNNTDVISEVLKSAGIPTTIVDGEALVPVELDLSAITHPDALQGLGIMEVDDLNADVINESELYALSDVSNVASPASSIHSSNYEFMEERQYQVVDHHSIAAERILDALLQGDVETAETFLPGIDESSMSSHQSSEYCEEVAEEDEEEENDSDDSYHPTASSSRQAVLHQASEPKKQERRGRKPGKKLSKTSAAYVKDKTLRKKEQNKTAATRYRQKKKMEFALILESEAELQKEHDALEKKKDDLHREILMVKQLLRDVIKARKPSTVPVGRTHNRRK